MMNIATAAFCEKGFHGTSLRDLARAAGMSQPAMYHYFPSKHALLVAISQAAVNSLIKAVDEALADSPDDPGAQLDRLVTAHVLCEIRVRRLSFVANTEVRSLEPYARDDFEAKRADVQGIYDRIISEGAGSGVFRNPHPLETAEHLPACASPSTRGTARMAPCPQRPSPSDTANSHASRSATKTSEGSCPVWSDDANPLGSSALVT